MYYTGIGSRETPQEVLRSFMRIAKYLAKEGYTLRSGGADGADLAFEHGCYMASGKMEIYLPWKEFNGSKSNLVVSEGKAFEIAAKYHPYWHNLKDGAKKLQARNSHQVLGLDLNTPSSFVICWTKGGKDIGGTAQAIRIARDYKIKVFNAGGYDTVIAFEKDLAKYLKSGE